LAHTTNPDVFLCHATEHDPWADALSRNLRELGYSCFNDAVGGGDGGELFYVAGQTRYVRLAPDETLTLHLKVTSLAGGDGDKRGSLEKIVAVTSAEGGRLEVPITVARKAPHIQHGAEKAALTEDEKSVAVVLRNVGGVALEGATVSAVLGDDAGSGAVLTSVRGATLQPGEEATFQLGLGDADAGGAKLFAVVQEEQAPFRRWRLPAIEAPVPGGVAIMYFAVAALAISVLGLITWQRVWRHPLVVRYKGDAEALLQASPQDLALVRDAFERIRQLKPLLAAARVAPDRFRETIDFANDGAKARAAPTPSAPSRRSPRARWLRRSSRSKRPAAPSRTPPCSSAGTRS